MGDYKRAEQLFKEAHELSGRIFNNRNIKLAFANQTLGNLYKTTKNYKLAEDYFKKALEVFINVINDYFPLLSESEKKNFWATQSEAFEAFYSFGSESSTEIPTVASEMYDLQLYSKALLFNSSIKIKNRIINSKDSALISLYDKLTEKKELLASIYSMPELTRKQKGFDLDSIEQSALTLEKQLSLKSEDFKLSYEKKKVTWKLIQGLLKPDEAAVEVIRFRYFDKIKWTDTIFYAFLIVTNDTEEHPDMIVFKNGNKLENEYYNEYRNLIKIKTKDAVSYDRFWGPLNEKLKNYKKIYFSPDGVYNRLNPSTLMMPDGKFLLDFYDIQQINSTKDILLGFYKAKQESNIFNNAVLIGNPNFSLAEQKVIEIANQIRSEGNPKVIEPLLADTRGIVLTNLPGTEKEIKNIEQFLSGKSWEVKTFLSDQAVKASVKTVQSPRILHIATHGLFLEDVEKGGKEVFGIEKDKLIDNPLLRSGLFFTGADNYLKSEVSGKTDDENGILTAFEAMNLNLDKTELVVLSACETGLGEIQNGEGVFGLRRAFQQAGARTVLMSLWKVNDEATQALMSQFYSYWITGMTKREAFTTAQQEVRKKYPDPYFWGAFVMVGE
jgi:CHAT domain-containing protein